MHGLKSWFNGKQALPKDQADNHPLSHCALSADANYTMPKLSDFRGATSHEHDHGVLQAAIQNNAAIATAPSHATVSTLRWAVALAHHAVSQCDGALR